MLYSDHSDRVGTIIKRSEVEAGECFVYTDLSRGQDIPHVCIELNRLGSYGGWTTKVGPKDKQLSRWRIATPSSTTNHNETVEIIPHFYHPGVRAITLKDLFQGECFMYLDGGGGRVGDRVTDKFILSRGLSPEEMHTMPHDWRWAAYDGSDPFIYSSIYVKRIPHWLDRAKIQRPDDKNRVLEFESIQRLADSSMAIAVAPSVRKDFSLAWSKELREKLKTSESKDKNQVVVDWGDWWD
jgi:hypothetical protein